MNNKVDTKIKHIIYLLIPVFLFLLMFLKEDDYFYSFLVFPVLFFLLIFFLKIEWGVYIIAFFLPVIGISFSFQSLELPIIDLISLLVLIAFILRELYFKLYLNKERIFILPFIIPFLFFLLFSFISAVLSYYKLGSVWYLMRWVLFFYLAFIVVPVNVIRSKEVLKKAILLVAASSVLVLAMGFYSLLVQDPSASFFRLGPVPILGQWLFGNNYNLLAEYLVLNGFLILSLKYWYKTERSKRVINLLSFLLIFGAFLSFGRTAWLAIFLQVFMFFVLYNFVVKKKKLDVKLILISLFLVSLIASPFFIRMISLQEANVSSTQNRLLLTRIAFSSFLDKPFFGHGPGTFVSLVDNNLRFVAKYGAPLDSHGLGQKLLAENGFLGFIAFFLFSFLIFRRMYLAVLDNREHYKLLLPLFVAVSGMYFYQFFNTSYYKGKLWFPIALMLAAIVIIENRESLKIKTKVNVNKEN